MLNQITKSFFIIFFFIIEVYAQVIDGEFLTNINNDIYEVTVAVNLQSDSGYAGIVQIEFTYNSSALNFPNSPIKNSDYTLHDDFDLYPTQNITKPDSNSIRISLITLGTPPSVPIDTAKTNIITYYFTITNPQGTSNLVWTQTEIAPAFLQPNYQVGNWTNLNEPLSNVTGVSHNQSVPETFNLCQNFPNPFNPETTIRFSLPQLAQIKINLYNMLGKLIETLAEGTYEAGNYKVIFNASNLPTGMYVYRIESNDFVQTKKMMLLK